MHSHDLIVPTVHTHIENEFTHNNTRGCVLIYYCTATQLYSEWFHTYIAHAGFSSLTSVLAAWHPIPPLPAAGEAGSTTTLPALLWWLPLKQPCYWMQVKPNATARMNYIWTASMYIYIYIRIYAQVRTKEIPLQLARQDMHNTFPVDKHLYHCCVHTCRSNYRAHWSPVEQQLSQFVQLLSQLDAVLAIHYFNHLNTLPAVFSCQDKLTYSLSIN